MSNRRTVTISNLLIGFQGHPPGLVLCGQGNGCFAKPPWEIREASATNLSTEDILNLVLSSKAFLPILTSRSFWALRFESGGDRDFFFEKRNNSESRDWITLYRLTGHAVCPRSLTNRR